MFFLCEARDLAIAQIPRCAINTMFEWLGREAIIVRNNDNRLRSITRRVAFIRDPIDRLESAFSLFYWMADYGRAHSSNAPVDSWENFVDHVLNEAIPDDTHWLPQSVHVGNVPNIYYKFENLADRWESLRPGILPWLNRTSRPPLIVANYRISELAVKYADDIRLYQGAD